MIMILYIILIVWSIFGIGFNIYLCSDPESDISCKKDFYTSRRQKFIMYLLLGPAIWATSVLIIVYVILSIGLMYIIDKLVHWVMTK